MTKPIRVLADENIPGLSASLSDKVKIKKMPGRAIRHDDLTQIDVLLVRSVTRVNAELLENTPVKFVGTATIGVDHVDADYLEQAGIGFSYAAGSNAQSVVEYVLAAITHWLQEQHKQFKDITIGIVGVGRIGGLLQRYLNHLEVDCLLHDPPLQAQQNNADYCDLVDIATADVITYHVPLTTKGPWPTRHMIDEQFITELSARQLLINSARGDILDNQMALNLFQKQAIKASLVLDVWQGEPLIDPDLLSHCLLGTPHIAGYAVEGKWRATQMLCQAISQYFNIRVNVEPLQKNIRLKNPWLPQAGDDLIAQISSYYPIIEDDKALRAAAEGLPQSFDKLRKNYPDRHEFLAALN